jgi:hypothetical protein
LTDIRYALRLTRLLARGIYCRQKYGKEHRDYGNDDKEFDEGETFTTCSS